MEPAVSVIIPVFNTEPFLGACLDSVLSQTFSDLEIICIDDASTDASPERLAGYAARDRRVRSIRQDRNRGASAARNAGLEAARGEFVYFLDSDDWIAPGYLEAMVEEARQSRSAIVVNTRFDDFPAAAVSRNPGSRGAGSHPLPAAWYPPQFIANKLLSVVWLRLYRRDFLRRSHLVFPETLQAAEDYYFTRVSGLAAGRSWMFSGPPLFHRKRAGSLSSGNRFDNIRAASLCYDELLARGLPTEGLKLFYTGQLTLDSEDKFCFTHRFFERIGPAVRSEADLYTPLDRFCLETVLACRDWRTFRQAYQPGMLINFVLAHRNPR